MLRGNHLTRMDAKGRIKMPADIRRYIEETYGTDFYITSVTGEEVMIYPLPEWIAIEGKLAQIPNMEPAKRKFMDRVNYFGKQASMDGQGRILVHPLLRTLAELDGEVCVVGKQSYLEVWNKPRYDHKVRGEPYLEEDAAKIAKFGI
ncbi:MAG: division/cell wall cluster transcriptional repressor MraZ [Acidobacteria bacterium]|nr:division/cell wall cluster transcriptional repressor MraZ [Acidobacteriota bacterium]